MGSKHFLLDALPTAVRPEHLGKIFSRTPVRLRELANTDWDALLALYYLVKLESSGGAYAVVALSGWLYCSTGEPPDVTSNTLCMT